MGSDQGEECRNSSAHHQESFLKGMVRVCDK